MNLIARMFWCFLALLSMACNEAPQVEKVVRLCEQGAGNPCVENLIELELTGDYNCFRFSFGAAGHSLCGKDVAACVCLDDCVEITHSEGIETFCHQPPAQ